MKELENAATIAKFISYAIDGTFVADLQADLALIGGKGGVHRSGQSSRINTITNFKLLSIIESGVRRVSVLS